MKLSEFKVAKPCCKRHAIQMALRWRADDGPKLNAGLELCDFSEDLDQYC